MELHDRQDVHESNTESPAVLSTEHAVSRTSVGKLHVNLSLEAALVPWLDCFDNCTTQWGLITDVRADGSTYQRHGIVVDLHADITRPLAKSSYDEELLLRRLRHAVDLVKLTLAVDPLVLKPLLMRRSYGSRQVREDKQDPNISEEELYQLAQGHAPFEVRLRLKLEARLMNHLERFFTRRFMGSLDQALVDGSDTLRRLLVEKVMQSTAARRLELVPVATVLKVSSYEANEASCGLYKQHFEELVIGRAALVRYQDQRGPIWAITSRWAPLCVEKIDLHFEFMPLSRRVMKYATWSVAAGIPTVCSRMGFDVRSMHCEERHIHAFLEAMTRSATKSEHIVIETGLDCDRVGDSGKDIRSNILTLLRCIGEIECGIEVDLTGLLMICQSRSNRQAIFSGLVQHILPRRAATSISIGGDTVLTEVDASDLLDTTICCRRDGNQGSKLRLQSLELAPEWVSIDFIRALLHVIDDVEDLDMNVSTDIIRVEDVQAILRFPSLRSLTLNHFNISTMEVFTSRSSASRLERLVLGGCRLANSASIVAFIKILDWASPLVNPLAHTLQDLIITQTDGTGFSDDEEDDDQDDDRPVREPPVRLAISDVAAVSVLHEVLESNKTLRYVNFIGNFRDFPVTPVFEFDHPPKTSCIPAPTAIRQGDLEKARKSAFLSVIAGDPSVTTRRLDSYVVRIIFEYSVPHCLRKLRVLL